MLSLGLSLTSASVGRGAFDPASLFAAGEQGGWYDIEPATTWQDTARTIPATVGSQVAAVTDKSGRGNHLVQATLANRPTLQQDAGGKYYLALSSAGLTFMTHANAPSAAPFYGALAVRDDTVSTYQDLWANKSASNGFRLGMAGSSIDEMRVGNGTAFSGSSVNFAAGANVVYSGRYASGLATARVNGVDGTSVSATMVAGQATGYLGKGGDSTNYVTGRVYGFIWRSAAMNDTNLRGVDAYLAKRLP